MTQLSRDKYVAFNSALRQPGGQASVGHNISAEDTYPKKCRIRHFLGFTFICGRSRRGNRRAKAAWVAEI